MTRLSARSHADRIGPGGALIETLGNCLGPYAARYSMGKTPEYMKEGMWMLFAKQERDQ